MENDYEQLFRNLQRMKIICANSVSLGREAFTSLGELKWLGESDIDGAAVHDADAVITRSKTRLNAELLAGSSVKFAGTCTAGTDHANLDELDKLGVQFASAPGCNANGVSEYVVAALLEAPGWTFTGKTVGIIGHGQVGTRVEKKLRALGCDVLLNDPPKEAAGASGPYVDLETLLEKADVVTIHVPLVEEGLWPTRGLMGELEIGKLREGAVLINACRGEVMDGDAVREARIQAHLSWLVLDVWDPEPCIPEELLAVADLGTPHIAGHSVEGKVNGTRQIREQLVSCFGLEVPVWDPGELMPAPVHSEVDVSEFESFESRLGAAVKACYDIRFDDERLRRTEMPMKERFVSQRRNYRDRREFSATRLMGVPEGEREVFRALGFMTER
ncbi:4-phosphoerythronate dehydrogenase [Kiritimatiellaeota bacterium B1221]|nr:4-phosphoerythronate dehydrogenase [Kiritimatiellaeota bacterium B1221]